MNPTTDTDFQQLFTQLIQKQILVLGPDITLAKVKNVAGLTVNADGVVQKIEGDPQKLLQELINQFVELSGMIVKKTMESILTSYPGMAALAVGGMTMSTPEAPASIASPSVSATTQHDASATADVPVVKPALSQNVDKPAVESIAHVEPPPMTAFNLNSLAPKVEDKKPDSDGPSNFSKEEMDDLNKALEALAKEPLSTDVTNQKPVVPVAAV